MKFFENMQFFQKGQSLSDKIIYESALHINHSIFLLLSSRKKEPQKLINMIKAYTKSKTLGKNDLILLRDLFCLFSSPFGPPSDKEIKELEEKTAINAFKNNKTIFHYNLFKKIYESLALGEYSQKEVSLMKRSLEKGLALEFKHTIF